MSSIRRQLLLWLLSGLALAVVAAGARIYSQTLAEANELFDYHLRQMAASLPNDSFGPLPPSSAIETEDGLVVQIWDRNGLELYFSRPASKLPQRAELGFSTVATAHGSWRVYSALERNNVVQVAQPMSVRRDLAAGMALRALLPLLALLPVLGVLIWLTIGRGLQPLERMAQALDRRTPDSLAPLSQEGLPSEIRPLVHAVNELLARLSRALESQKAFVADAAHELRTPLTAVQLQIQLAERAKTEGERDAAFAKLKHGQSRAAHLVQQLLTLARQEPGVSPPPHSTVELAEAVRLVISELAPLAANRNIALGLSHEAQARISGDFDALRVMLGNVIDNAIRYTPAGGAVDVAVRLQERTAVVEIADTGPGIPQEDRARVFDRFYRRVATHVAGSGLGLAIVKNIADRHHASIGLANRDPGPGLRVTIAFPLA
ncbi:MAG: two-component sensor histidine kinase [Burkholderiales bacterium]|nr:two-component sensor histidine kinase [Burkholderiales bacterium]